MDIIEVSLDRKLMSNDGHFNRFVHNCTISPHLNRLNERRVSLPQTASTRTELYLHPPFQSVALLVFAILA